MPYTKTDWKNRAVEKPRTFQLQENGDGTYTLIPAEGTIYEAGTPVNAVNMNKMEQGIKDTETLANAKLPKDGSEAMTGTLKTQGIDSTTLTTTRKQLMNSNTTDIFLGNDTAKLTLESSQDPLLLRAGQTFKFWHSGNDGSGSTLDADLLRGFVLSTVPDALTVAHRDNQGVLSAVQFRAGGGSGPNGGFTFSSDGSFDTGMFSPGDGDIRFICNGQEVLKMLSSGMTYGGAIMPPTRNNGGVYEWNDNGTWRAAGGVKSVQRGVASIAGNGNTDIGITAVNTAKAYVVGNFTLSAPDVVSVTAELLNSTTVRIRHNGGYGGGSSYAWQVIESW